MSERLHTLKTWPEHFEALSAGRKTAEMRLNDRDFKEGEHLDLCEYDPSKSGDEGYTGRSITVKVTHVLHGPGFGVEPGYCMLSFTWCPGFLLGDYIGGTAPTTERRD